MVLFLDFDGVLHPDEVYRMPGRGIVLQTANLPDEFQHLNLFCYADQLADVLDGSDHVRIVLSTSWVSMIGYGHTLSRLPNRLQQRVIGSTYYPRRGPRWCDQTRYEQIRESVVSRRFGKNWIALDNDGSGWPESQRDRLVHTDDYRGLGDPEVIKQLKALLDG